MFSTPATLLARLRDRADADSWDRFVALYTPLLYSWTRSLKVPQEDAADLLQDLFTTLLEQLPSFTYDPTQSFRAWMRTLLVNRWRTWQRRQAVRKAVPDGAALIEEAVAPEEAPEFEQEEYRRHLVARAMQIMQSEFQPATWKACWEYVVCERDPREVAAELGITVNAVYLAKSRVLRRLREELADILE